MGEAEAEDGPAVLRRTVHAEDARHERADTADGKLHLVQSLVKQGHMPSMVLMEVDLERAGV
jgi:CHASE1-domain containing sensor protein